MKEKSLKKIFLQYLAIFCGTVMANLAVLGVIMLAGLQFGLIIPSNYVENVLHKSEEYMQKYGSYEWIPTSCEYAVYNDDGTVLYQSDFLEDTQTPYVDYLNHRYSRGNEYYYTFSYNEELCIVKYRVESRFRNQHINEILPNPFVCSGILFFLLFLLEVIVLANRYTKKMTKELATVKRATQNIQMNQLDFNHETTQIKEFNEVLDSLNHMKEELTHSLISQWNMEEMRRQQIQALAHDIKTPLTVLLGNADLLEETNLTKEQMDYYEKIIQSADDMETYLKALLVISKMDRKESLSFQTVEIKTFFEMVKTEAEVLTKDKRIAVELIKEATVDTILADEHALKRILMNLISNSAEYTNINGRIRITVSNSSEDDQGCLQITVEDSGRGFTQQELKRATEQFYQGDESRSNRNHYGLGLFSVKNLVEGHGGKLKLSNSKELGGAKVEIILPLSEHYEG